MVRACFFLSLLYVASRVRVLVFLEFVYWLFLYYANAPGLSGGRGEMAMAVPCCPLRGSAACGCESRLIGSLCSVSVVISNGLQPSLEGLGPRPSLSTVGRKPGHDTSQTLLNGLQPSLEGLGPRPSLSTVGRKPGHGTSRVTKSRRRIGRDQPTEMGERRVSERTPMVDGFRYPLATRHPHVTTPGNRQPDRS